MGFSLRLKKALAGASIAAIAVTQVGSVLAAYSDVPSGIWYGDAVNAFVDSGYLDASQARFRGGDPANRAEFVKLVVELNGGILSTPPAVPSFDDVATGAWYYGYFEEAGKELWVRGDGDCYGSHPCYARPGANINRAEAAALIVRAFGLTPTGDAAQFVDNPSGQWYTNVMQTAADHCVLQGDDATGRVRPGDNMNRAEMVVMLYRVDQGLTYGVDCGSSAGAEAMVTDVVAVDSKTIEVEFNVTLDQASAEDASHYMVTGSPEIGVVSADLLGTSTVSLVLAEDMEAGHEYTLTVEDLMTAAGVVFGDVATFMGYTAFVQGEGILELSLSAANPVGDTVPSGSVGVVLLSVDLTASCADSVAIENLTILHEGFGAVTDIDGVYAAVNGARVTRKRTIDSEDQTADLRFSSPLILDPCETVTVDVVADYSSTATTAAEHNLVVELPSDIFGNAKSVAGNFPLRGDTFRIAAVTSGVVTVTYRTVSPDEIEVGDVGVVIGKFEVSVNSTEDQTFYSMTFEQNSSASDGDFVNIAIRRTDGTILTNTVSQTVGDFVTAVYDPPFTVLEGDKITLEIIADIVGGAGDSIIMHFEESSDLFAVGSLYGYGVNGQLYGSRVSLPSETSDLPDTVNIDAGEFTVGIDGPPQQDYTRDDNDAVLANVTFQTGGEDVDVKDIFVLIQGVSSTGGLLCGSGGSSSATASCATGSDDTINEVLEDVEIRNKTTGRTIDGVRLTGTSDAAHGVVTGAVGTYQIYRFDDFVVRGDETWEFRIDFIDNGSGNHPKSGDKFKIHICGEPTHTGTPPASNATGCSFASIITSSTSYQMQVEGLSTGDKIGDVRPRGNLAGNFHRIATATLTVAVKETGTGDTSVENAPNIALLRFEARAGEAEDILFTKAIFESASGTALSNGQNYALWVDTDGDGVVDTILEDGVASQSSQVTFSDLAGGGYVIPAEETVAFEVHADVSSDLTGDDLMIRFDTGTTVTYIEAEELDDGSSLSNIKTNATCRNSAGTVTTNCDIVVTTVFTQNWHLVSQGDLYVTKDSTPIRSRQLLGGTLAEEILRLQLHAEHEDVDVTDIQLTSSGSLGDTIDSIELYRSGESTAFAVATKTGCGTDNKLDFNPRFFGNADGDSPATNGVQRNGSGTVTTFCANMENQQLVVANGADVDVVVRPRMKRDEAGGKSNKKLALFVGSGVGTYNNVTVQARGGMSSNDLTMSDQDGVAEGEVFVGAATATSNSNSNSTITGGNNITVLAKILNIANANSDANLSAVPTGVYDFAKFRFSAASHNNTKTAVNDAVISGIVFNITATNVSMNASGFKIYNQADSTQIFQCEPFDSGGVELQPYANGTASGSIFVDCRGLVVAAPATEIDQGTDIVLVLQGDVRNPVADGSSTSTLQAQIQNFDSITRLIYGVASGESHFQWLDAEASVTSTTPKFNWVEFGTTSVSSVTYQS